MVGAFAMTNITAGLRRALLCGTALIGITLAAPAQAVTNLVINPGFETTPDPTGCSAVGWTVTGTCGGTYLFEHTRGRTGTKSGTLANSYDLGSFSQNISLSAGKYNFSFYYNVYFPAPGNFKAIVGSNIFLINTSAFTPYTLFTQQVTLPAGTITVSFTTETGGYAVTIDDISLIYLGPNSLASLLPANAPTNLTNVAGAIDAFTSAGGTLPGSFNALYSLTGSALTNALAQISGELGASGGVHSGVQMTNSFLSLLLNPFSGSPGGNFGSLGNARGFAAEQDLPPEVTQAYAAVTPKDRRPATSTINQRWGIWGSAYGGYNKTNGDVATGSNDTTARTYGVAAGADYRATPDLLLGFALAGGGTNFGLANSLGSGKSDVFQMGIYGTKKFGASYVSAALSYAWFRMSTNRTALTDQLTANFNANNFGGRLEAGHRFALPVVSVTPYGALQVQQFRTPSYSESVISGPGAFALSYNSNTTTATRTELGAWFDKTFALNSTSLMTLRTRAAWAHDHSNSQSVNAAFQTLPGSSFTVNGAATAPNSALLSAGAEIKRTGGMIFGVKFDGEFANRSQTYAGTGTVRYNW